MALYTNDSRDRVRDVVDFVELVSARTELRRAGPARYEGLCPFHDERTPSFGIDPAQKVYHCFGCQASGDLFTFVQETEGVDFKEALELLADRYGVELQREQEDPRATERRRRRERLLDLLARTSAYYERYLWQSAEAARARAYLAGRGLAEEILKEFHVGYAPSAWDRVLMASRRGGFSVQELYATGLAQRSKQNGQPYDRFRSRIMFPLADVRGRVLGFGARAMRAEQRPKYLNTSDNDVYHKGRHLYGADLARAHAARAGSVILCEGYTDTIALHQAGIRNAVGLMGTALTPEQVSELARMAQTLLLALDADSAGREAMLRASTLASARKLELRVVPLPPGTDPAELVQRDGARSIEALIGESVPFVRFRVERALADGDHSSPEGRDAMIEALRPVFATLPPSAMRMELTRIVSGRLALSETLAESLLSPSQSSSSSAAPRRRATRAAGEPTGPLDDDRHRPAGKSQGARGRVLERREDTERAFLALCIAFPDQGERALQSLDVHEHFSSELLRRAAARLRAGSLREPLADRGGGALFAGGPDASSDVPDVGAAGPDVPAEVADANARARSMARAGGRLEGDPQLKDLLAELVVEAGREQSHADMLEVQRLQLELAGMDRKIRRARGQDRGDVSALALRRAEVKREFDRAYGRVLEETGGRAG